jgi:hypothetical protein
MLRIKSESGCNMDILSDSERNKLINILSQDVKCKFYFTPQDNLKYEILSESDYNYTLRVKNKIIKIKCNWRNYQEKINKTVRKQYGV